jgi:flagellar protein FlaG
MDIKYAGSNASSSSAYLDAMGATPAPLPLPQQSAAIPSVLPGAAIQQPEPTATLKQLNDALQSINKTMRSLSADVEFSVDGDTGRTIVRVTDRQTGDLLRQMPSKEALEIAKALDKMQGLLIRQKA